MKDIVNAKLKFRERLAPIVISVVSICATVMLLEIAIRIIKPQDIGFWDSHSIRRVQNTPPHFVENIPHGRANLFGVQVSINSYGLREDEINVPKPPHTFRLLAVGDSITFGYGVPVEETYVKVLEKRMNENAPANIRYEVLNGGTIGGSLGDYYHLLNQKAALLKPDLVLVGLALNDILVYSESGSILGQRDAQRHGRGLVLIRKLNRFLLRHSQLYIFCYARLKSFLYGSGVLDINTVQGLNFVALAPPSAYQKEAWGSSLRMLSKIVEFCRGRGYRIAVIIFPVEMQLSPAELHFYRDQYHLRLGDEALSGEPQRRVREFGATTGVTVVDLLPAFRAHHPGDLYLRNKMIPADASHLSIKGHHMAADEIFRVLRHSLVDTTCPATADRDRKPGRGRG